MVEPVPEFDIINNRYFKYNISKVNPYSSEDIRTVKKGTVSLR